MNEIPDFEEITPNEADIEEAIAGRWDINAFGSCNIGSGICLSVEHRKDKEIATCSQSTSGSDLPITSYYTTREA